MRRYTAREVAEMAAHIRRCARCFGGDQDILASLNEGVAPEELEEYIQGSH